MEKIKYPLLHCHDEYSNIRFLDSISKFKDILNYSKEIELNGLALTNHESLSGSVKALQLVKKMKKQNLLDKDFKFIIGNEIYLVNEQKQRKQTHFILLAKDYDGYNLLKELSSKAWEKAFNRGKITFVPMLKTVFKKTIEKNKGHLIAQTACIGGELPQLILQLDKADKEKNIEERQFYHNKIVEFVLFCKDLFEEDFYFEIQPSNQEEQIVVNNWLKKLSKVFNVKLVITTDAHYIKKEDRPIHKAYLTSREAEREVDSFYESTYMMSSKEMFEWKSIKNIFTEEEYLEILNNTNSILNKIEEYDMFKTQEIPHVDKTEELKQYMDEFTLTPKMFENYPMLKRILEEDIINNKYWLYRIYKFLKNKNLLNEEYLSRINLEAEELFGVTERLHSNVFDYYVTMTKLMDIAWNDAQAIVGIGRGSAGAYLSSYALEIHGIDPVKNNLPHWRHLTKERPEMPDIDFDTPASRRKNLLLALKKYFGDDKVLNIGTFKTEGTKSAILSACRGYRSDEFPNGIEIDIAQYLSSLIPQERGKLWNISDVIYGNKKKDRKPSREFIEEIKKYKGLIDIIIKIEGLVCGRSIHASGIYITNESYIKTNAMMKAPNGQETSQFDMADSDYQGNIKFDALTIEALDIIQKCIELLIRDGYIEQKATLKETYESVIGPNVLVDKKEYWDIAAQRKMLSCFQFDTAVGSDAIAKIQPDNISDAMQANSLMRLMASEKGAEMPLDKFVRYKNNISLWYKEMEKYGLTKKEQFILEKYLKQIYGVASTQEDLMRVVMDPDISGFNIVEANKLRKAIAKKKTDLMEEVKNLFYNKCAEKGTSKNLADYVWHEIAIPQAGYSFSCIHTLSYSTIALQELMLYKNYPSIYWNTSVLLVNSASVEEFINEEFIEKQYDEEGNEIKETEKNSSLNYDKIAKSLGIIIKAGIDVTPPLINFSSKDFEPDVKNNRILYSLKALSGVGDKEIEQIIDNRPYTSLENFLEKNNIKKPAVISLIKAGAFDELENKNRTEIMKEYIIKISDTKKVLNMRNFQALMRNNLLPKELEYQCRLFEFNRYIRQKQFKKETILLLDLRAQDFMLQNYPDFYDTGILNNDFIEINEKAWKKVYDKEMLKAKQYIIDNNEELLDKYNNILIEQQWNKYCLGNISKWEMDSMSFYYHEHELSNVNLNKYGISNFSELQEEPVIDRIFEIKNRQIPIYKIEKIIGTCIGKNNIKNTFTLLTSDGEVVDIRLTKEHYAYYNKQISEIENGTKKVKEKSWFTRGTKLMVVGIRRGSGFMAKKYKNTGGHRLYKINDVDQYGDLIMVGERYGA